MITRIPFRDFSECLAIQAGIQEITYSGYGITSGNKEKQNSQLCAEIHF
ncbi:hypothetical protein OQZ29_12960 [Pedobacter agri]|uniref:Uncharacterized protein n=1 Tax=Pedobacter agri TaxID=454586 RepID=A0A9X3IA46_9SPHI|nr:hypothetical protein [Pedobacter agri]MCX3265664.1 hypothetical protein [Pedobacter agri]